MKKLLSVVFIIFLLSLSSSVLANTNSVTIINKGEQIELVNPIIERNNDYYISLDDLESINIGYEYYGENEYGLGQLNGPMKYTFYLDSGRLEYTNSFENAVFVDNEKIYISLGILIDLYSDSYATDIDYSNKVFNLWINDYKTITRWVFYEIDSSIPISDEGLEVELYQGFKRFVSYGSAYNLPVPELFEGVETTHIPEKTDVYNIGNSHTIKSSEKHIFYDNARTYKTHYDIAINQSYGVNSGGTSLPMPASVSSSSGGVASGGVVVGGGAASGGGGGGSAVNGVNTAGIKIDNDVYVGGHYESVTATKTFVTLTLDDCMEYISVSGNITVPEHSEELGYIVVAELNNRTVLNPYGAYETERDFATYQAGVFSPDETTHSYNLKLKPVKDDHTYTVYIIFGNGEYVRQYEIYDNLKEDKVLNFDNFVESKEITGRIKLPDGVNSFTDAFGDSLSSISGYVTLQGAARPYYIVRETEVEIDIEVGYADFVLRDDLGVDNGYVSFDLGGGGIREIYKSGVYYDDSSIKYIAEDGKPIPTDTKNIVLNIAKGKPFIIDVNHEVNSNVNMTMNILKDGEPIPSDKKFVLYLDTFEIDYIGNDPIFHHGTKHLVVVPEDTDRYVLELEDTEKYGYPLYLNEDNYWVWGLENPVILTTEDLINGIGTTHKGYEPPTPIEITYHGYSSDNGHVYDYYVDTDFSYEATIYVGYYGENNRLLYLETRPQTFKSRKSYELYFEFDETYEPLSEYIKMFVWTDGLKPLSNVTIMKPAE